MSDFHRFSARLKWQEPANPLSQALEYKRRAGTPLFDLTESNPTRAGLPYAADQILSALGDRRALLYEPVPQGRREAREAVAAYYRQHGVAVDPGNILLTASTSEAYSYLFQMLADPGEEILSPQPSYPLFDFLAGLASVTIRPYPLRYDGGWHIDFAQLERSISARTRALVVVNPNNPTGSFLKRDELRQLESLAQRHQFALISDEVFCDYPVVENDPQRVVTLAGERQALTFSMSGLSKVAGLPQMKLGWIVVSGTAAAQALEALELIADTYLSVASPVQVALPELLQNAGPLQNAIRVRTAANRTILSEAVAGSTATLLQAEGGWYAILQVPRTRTEEEWALQLLTGSDVLVQPGFFFDFESEAFLVLSLLTPQETFAEGVRRLRAFL